MIRWIKKGLPSLLFVGLAAFLYAASGIGVNPETRVMYHALKRDLRQDGHRAAVLVISGRRWKADNALLVRIGKAQPGSRHLQGEALDLLVLDVNRDGKADSRDVEIVRSILDTRIVRDRGSLGTYPNAKRRWSRQMVHFDSRGHRARWRH